MRNTALFCILFLGILAGVCQQLARPTRTAVVKGRFTEEFRGIDGRYAYLMNEDNRPLDSCLMLDNSFTLTTDVRAKQLPVRIRFARLDLEQPLTLRPGRRVALTVRPPELQKQYEEAVREAIARLDSAGLTIPDSLWYRRRKL